MWIYPTVLPPTRSPKWDCAVACVTIEQRESRREQGLGGKRRSKNGQGINPEKELGLYRKCVPSAPKELVFFLPCTNSLIYCMSTEVSGTLQPHHYFPYGVHITTERRCKRGGGRKKDQDKQICSGPYCTHTHTQTQKMWPVLVGTVYD